MRGSGSLQRPLIRRATEGLAALVFPRYRGCALCGAPPACRRTDDPGLYGVLRRHLCEFCLRDLLVPRWSPCERCGRPGRGQDGLCGACWQASPPYGRARAVGFYYGALREALLRFKYGRQVHLAEPLGALLAWRLATEFDAPDAVVPVPLHPRKLRARGFNQSLLLARAVCRFLPLANLAGALVRARDTAVQAGLDREARAFNVASAFAVPEPWVVTGRSLVLIDDIYTTGATVSACAEVLLESGARRVDVLVVAYAL